MKSAAKSKSVAADPRAESGVKNDPGRSSAWAERGTGCKPRLELTTLKEMAANPPTVSWDVEGVLTRGQPMVVGGASKTLKTSLAIDLALSLSTATPFLGQFPVPARRRAALFSGESGGATVYETAARVARSKGKKPGACRLQLGFVLPQLARVDGRNELRALIRGEGLEVVVIDPLYLALGGAGVDTNNLFKMGPVLRAAADACLAAGATPVLLHHVTKSAAARGGPLTLLDLSAAGVGEFARQWMLVNRSAEYEPGSGRHDLELSIGGSAGHSSGWRLAIDEGRHGADRREWRVAVGPQRRGKPPESRGDAAGSQSNRYEAFWG